MLNLKNIQLRLPREIIQQTLSAFECVFTEKLIVMGRK